MGRKFYLNLSIGLVTLIVSILIFYHGYLYGGMHVLAMVIDYLIGSIFFMYSLSRLKRAIKSIA